MSSENPEIECQVDAGVSWRDAIWKELKREARDVDKLYDDDEPSTANYRDGILEGLELAKNIVDKQYHKYVS